jgi:hypothetical protein
MVPMHHDRSVQRIEKNLHVEEESQMARRQPALRTDSAPACCYWDRRNS